MHDFKRFVKRIPGTVYAVRKLRDFLNSRAPRILQGGDWIYEREVIEWLCRPSARKQLPLLYRIYAAYCASQYRWGKERIIGGQQLHQAMISLRTALRLKDYSQLRVGPYTMFVDLNDPRMLHIPNEVAEGYPDTSILKRFLTPGDTFVDVGANHGSFSIVASQAVGPKGFVVAIEPQKRLAALIEKSLAANAPCRYQVHRVACGDRTDEVDFYVPIGSSGGAGVFREFSALPRHRKFSVSMRRFDDAVDWNNFPGQVFVKVDVEGSEMNFLRGAGEMIRARKPRMMLEINPASRAASGEKRNAMVAYLQELGYAHFFEVRPFSGPWVLRELLNDDGRRDVRNVIVTARDAFLRMLPLGFLQAGWDLL